MSFVSYAQNYEDVILWRVLKGVEDGYYVDIGSEDPIHGSVSYAFSQKGWRGLSVEPTDEYFNKFRQVRPNDDIVQAFVSDKRSSLDFYVIENTGLSTADFRIAEEHKALGHDYFIKKIETITIQDLWEKSGRTEIHWLKIDVEGHEEQILRGWNDNVRPWVLVVEAYAPLSEVLTNNRVQTHELWESIVLEKGYLFVYADGLNRFYLHENHLELRYLFEFPPNVIDDGYVVCDSVAVEKEIYEEKVRALISCEVLLDERHYKDEVRAIQNRLNELERKRTIELAKAEEKENQLKDALQISITKAQQLERKLHNVYASTSWRLTSPIRKIKQIFGTEKV